MQVKAESAPSLNGSALQSSSIAGRGVKGEIGNELIPFDLHRPSRRFD